MTTKTKTVNCAFCGVQHQQVTWAYGPYSCGTAECERELIECERERQEAREEAAREDNYGRY